MLKTEVFIYNKWVKVFIFPLFMSLYACDGKTQHESDVVSRIAILKSSNANLNVLLESDIGRDIGSILDEPYLDTENAIVLPAKFTGSISGNVLHVTAVSSGVLAVGQTIQWASSGGREPMITSFGTGSGNIGTYNLSLTLDNNVISQSMNSCAAIVVPSWAKYISVVGHIEFPQQVDGDGFASVHLFRNAGATPLQGDMAYHFRTFYSASNPSYTAITAYTGKIPVMIQNEVWSLRGFQNSGAAQTLYGGFYGGLQWMTVEFYEK